MTTEKCNERCPKSSAGNVQKTMNNERTKYKMCTLTMQDFQIRIVFHDKNTKITFRDHLMMVFSSTMQYFDHDVYNPFFIIII